MEENDRLRKVIDQIVKKYESRGQDPVPYLEGLLNSRYLDYWDYLNLEALLNLQTPRTNHPDEMVFILYHQITELYFKLSLWELQQILNETKLGSNFFKTKLHRVNNYFENLTHSFKIMIQGMDHEQFLKFRTSLYPASGFQSLQYRLIEICSTNLINLIHSQYKGQLVGHTIEEKLHYIYWRFGATELDTGKKSLTLERFEQNFFPVIKDWAAKHDKNNLWTRFQQLPEDEKQDEELVELMKKYDLMVNVEWPLQHYKSAARYLSNPEGDIPATGGTNWQKYLPPRFQRRIFFPDLYTVEELQNWGIGRRSIFQ